VKVLVFGATGWLGSRYLEHCHGIDAGADICRHDEVLSVITGYRPDVVINAAGKTHSAAIPNIDACVATPQATLRTFQVNAEGAGVVALACAEARIPLVHLSSGCIFDGGDRPFIELETPNPPSWYAETKVAGERLIQEIHPSALLLRIRMPISAKPHPRNLLTKLSTAKQIVDVVNSVTVVEDLLDWTVALIQAGTTGIVHAVHPQPIAFRTLMQWYREIVDPAHTCEFIPKEQYITRDGRSNCVLGTRDLPIQFRSTEDAVQRALRAYAGALACQ
jgi:dTDP-4-dehydrorhamnose reductase